MTPLSNKNLQKLVVVTASNDFDDFGRLPDEIIDDETVFTLGEVVMKVNTKIMREYSLRTKQLYFDIRIIQSLKAGEGKTMLINSQIDEIIKENKNKFRVFHHFVYDSNQPFPAESFENHGYDVTNIIHFQFSDEIMKKGIKFWSYLYQLYFYGFFLPANKEPVLIQLDKTILFFEIPQLHKKYKSIDEFPLQDLSDFPLPISSSSRNRNPIEIENTKLENHNTSQNFKCNKDYYQYYNLGIECVLNELFNPKFQDLSLDNYIHEIFNQFFNPKRDEIFVINFRKLGFIERYLHKYTKLYINSLPKNDDKINLKQFAAFFYTLTVSSFYAYDCLPRKKSYATEEEKLKDRTGKGLTFITVDNLFNDDTSNYEKKIHFYTTKDRYEFFKCFEIDWFNSFLNDFTITFSYSDENRKIYNIRPPEILRNIFSTNEEYKKNIEIFKKENPESFLSRIQMTVPALFRFSVILSRIFLSQPIILSGDTGCGKTSALMLLFEYFKIPYNKQKYSLNAEVCNTLNCHGGVGADDVINHLKKAPKSSKKHIIFFDELNTSPASSFIEHLFLNGSHRLFNCKFVFIGALNPWKTKNPISYQLTKVRLPQLIINEEKEMNLIERINDNETNQEIPEKKYDVHHLQQSTEDIIFDFNPISNERWSDCEVLHRNEEKYSVHLIIESMAKYPTDETRTEVLEDLKKSIDKCIKFIRKLMKERAIISYRDVERSMKIYNFLFEYYNKYDQRRAFERLGIRPTDISTITVIISFVLRLPNHQIVSDEDLNKKDKFCSRSFKKVFDEYFGDDEYKHGEYENGVFILNIRDQLISLLSDNYHVYDTKKKFMIFVYQYTLDFLKVKSIWKFKSTFIHLFVMDVCIKCNLPCFVIGMPGTSKTFAVKLLKDHYKDKMYLSTYMSSRVSSEDGIKSIYYDAIFKEIEDESKDNLNVVFIEEMGNANINPSHPLKILHGILDNGLVLNETGYCKTVPTIGVSSYTMDLAIMNRGVLVYTELPDIYEILKVFEYDASQRAEDITDVSSFIERVRWLDMRHMTYIFQNLWPSIWPGEFGMPKTIALRSVYNIRFLIDKKESDYIDAHSF